MATSKVMKTFIRQARHQHFPDGGTVEGPVDAKRRIRTNRLGADHFVNIHYLIAMWDGQEDGLTTLALERFEIGASKPEKPGL